MNGKRLGLVAAALALSATVVTWVTRRSAAPLPVVQAAPTVVAPTTGGTPPAAAPVVATRDAPALAVDWNRRYWDAPDFFALTAEMAGAALGGDGRAAYVIGQVLVDCKLDEIALRPYGGTVAERVEAYFAAGGVVSEAGRAKFRRRVTQCERLFSDDPFAALELPDEAREFQYWRDRALALEDPLAVAVRAMRTSSQYAATDDPELARQYREELLRDVRVGVKSRDPAALLAIGGLMSQPSLVDNPEAGFAWWAAACQSGYDCSNANPDVGRGCVEAGTCDAGSTTLDVLQRDLSPAKYAAIYAAGQDILYKVNNDDWDGLQQYLVIK